MAAKIISRLRCFDCVVFGATGDLTLRKLLPALYYRFRDGQMPAESHVIGAGARRTGRRCLPRAASRHWRSTSPRTRSIPRRCERFLRAAVLRAARRRRAGRRLAGAAKRCSIRIACGCSTSQPSPDLYGPICRNIGAHGLATEQSRVVLEKPIGHDLASAREINDQVGEVFAEAQIFRIDHYLGKETVQNLMALRFANTIFERLWTTDVIDHVQITVAETVGVEGRGGYYDHAGRDARHGAEPHAAAAVPDRDGAAGVAGRRPGARREAEGAARAASDRAARGRRR